MFGFAWLTLRQAQDALRSGRLEEAQRLLSQSSVQGHQRAGVLQAQLGRAFAERGERRLGQDDAEGAWKDLLQAEPLQPAEKSVERLRQALCRLNLAQARALFQAGDLRRADEALLRLRERGVRSAEIQVLEDAVKGWLRAQELAERGEFALAVDQLERLRRLIFGPVKQLEEFAAELRKRQVEFPALLARLHGAADAGQWREVVEIAEQVLALAPQHGEARRVRSRAWKAIEPATVAMRSPAEANGHAGAAAMAETANEPAASRFILWIDGVGAYMVCLGARLTFGQAFLDPHADVPLVADVSRMHASLTRDSEGYVLEAMRPVQVNGNTTSRALLRPGDRVTLGASCQFQFHQPVPVSSSARVDLVSGHRLPVAVDAVLLMADTLVLDRGPQAHVCIADLKSPVVFFRSKDGLGVRHPGRLSVNGTKAGDRALLPARAVVSADDIAFAIEPG